jgi:transcriptional regulator with GAF, ATPase, and Fis domain
MQNNNIAVAGIALVNEQRQNAVIQKGRALVDEIIRRQKMVADSAAKVAEYQKGVAQIAAGDINASTVLGLTIDTNTPSGATVQKVLDTLNKAKQDEVAVAASRLSNAILGEQKNQDDLNKQIGKLQAELLDLTISDITPAQVLG